MDAGNASLLTCAVERMLCDEHDLSLIDRVEVHNLRVGLMIPNPTVDDIENVMSALPIILRLVGITLDRPLAGFSHDAHPDTVLDSFEKARNTLIDIVYRAACVYSERSRIRTILTRRRVSDTPETDIYQGAHEDGFTYEWDLEMNGLALSILNDDKDALALFRTPKDVRRMKSFITSYFAAEYSDGLAAVRRRAMENDDRTFSERLAAYMLKIRTRLTRSSVVVPRQRTHAVLKAQWMTTVRSLHKITDGLHDVLTIMSIFVAAPSQVSVVPSKLLPHV